MFLTRVQEDSATYLNKFFYCCSCFVLTVEVFPCIVGYFIKLVFSSGYTLHCLSLCVIYMLLCVLQAAGVYKPTERGHRETKEIVS